MEGIMRRLSRTPPSMQRQKKEYKDEKKRVASELVCSLRDPTVVVMADWLKVRRHLLRQRRSSE